MLNSAFYALLTTALFNTSSAFAVTSELSCNLIDTPKSSSLKIRYADDLPILLSLKSPGSDVYRDLDFKIEVVVKSEYEDSFTAQPKLKSPIDWNIEPNCFKEVGTQWYFVFDFEEKNFSVYLTPHLETQNERCVPPRFRPQPKALTCQFIN